MTQQDVELLNRQTTAKREANGELPPKTGLSQRNLLRQIENRAKMHNFAMERGQRIYLFAANHTNLLDERHRLSRSRRPVVSAHATALHRGDGDGFNSPGIFSYTKNMPLMILSNISTPNCIVNGVGGKATKVVVDPKSICYHINNIYTFVSRPPLCVIVEKEDKIPMPFRDLSENEVPIFPMRSYGKVKGLIGKIRREQVPLVTAFCITDIKSQGKTYEELLMDLVRKPNAGSHQQYASVVVQLGRVKTLKGVWLREPVQLSDLSAPAAIAMRAELRRLEALDVSTYKSWAIRMKKENIIV